MTQNNTLNVKMYKLNSGIRSCKSNFKSFIKYGELF